jgi:hypothetical protein
MKKIMKRISVVIFAMMFLILPASTAYASTTSRPVLLNHSPEDTHKLFMYQPDPLDVLPGQTVYLEDTTNDSILWHVPAGKKLDFSVSTPAGIFNCQVYLSDPNGGSGIVYDMTGAYSGFGYFSFPARSNDCDYLIFLTSYTPSGYPAQIHDYMINIW